MKYVSPSVKETAFNCPHCDAFVMHCWWDLYSRPIRRENRLPIAISPENRGEFNLEH